MSQGLPKHLRVLRDRVLTTKNALDALERLEFASEWGAVHSPQKKDAAYKKVEDAAQDIADAIGVQPEALARLEKAYEKLKAFSEGQAAIIARRDEQIAQLTQANANYYGGRSAA